MVNNHDFLPVWKALADQKRRQVVRLLAEKPYTTGELCAFFDVSRYAVMKHLKLLEESGLIESKRDGRNRWHSLNEEMWQALRQELDNAKERPYQLQELVGLLVRERPVTQASTPPPTTLRIEKEFLLPAPREQVFRALIWDITTWWQERTLEDSLGVFLEPRLNGRLYEALDQSGQGVLLATVTYIRQNQELRLQGPFDMTDKALVSTVRLLLQSEDEEATYLRLNHRAAGEVNAQLQQHYAHMWQRLFGEQLRSYIETDIPIAALA